MLPKISANLNFRRKLKDNANHNLPTVYVIGMVTLLGIFLRLYGLGDKTFWGDEIGSLVETENVLENPHSILFYLIMHFWTGVSISVIWNRIPPAIFGILSIISVYYLILYISDNKTAYLTAFLLTLNAFHIGYSQEIRFYSLFLLTSSLCFLFCFRFIKTRKKFDLVAWCLFGLLTVTSHMLGVLAFLISVLIWFFDEDRISGRRRIHAGFLIVLICLSAFGVLIFARGEVFEVLYRLMARQGASSELRGFIPTNIAKIPVAFYFFLVGQTTNPGNILWVRLCAAILGFFFFRGLYQETQKGRILRILTLTMFPVLLLFLFLDMIVPKNFPGAEPKYVIFVLPFILFLVAEGCFFKKKTATVISMSLVIILSTGNLFAYYSNTYNANSYKLIDLNGLRAFVSKYRAMGAVYYSETPEANLKFFPWENGAKSFWDLVSRWERKEKIVPEEYAGEKILIKIDGIYRKDLNFLNSFIETLQKGFVLENCFHSHGVQAFLFSPLKSADCPIAKDGEVLFPTQFYSLPYDSLNVNRLVSGGGRHFELDSATNEKSIKIGQGRSAKAIEIKGHLIGCTPAGEKKEVGFLLVTDVKGKQRKFIFENGVNIGDWKTDLRNKKLSEAQFKKKIMLVGRSSYPDAYKEFDAKIHKAIFDLSELDKVEKLELKLNSQNGRMVVWGIRLLD